ncbi:hypothetical protein SKAU_G00144560 [Synaphobranchus kaupii]|uniref:Uncharacterized protein n=1 Tax=Synaphobranchus kaupii TaxID=118154 RepID=A0A9Q1FTU9_SYNKA|nr:hypothetical protein SKAU_G00144560 [Synaphobranchus kaupii]
MLGRGLPLCLLITHKRSPPNLRTGSPRLRNKHRRPSRSNVGGYDQRAPSSTATCALPSPSVRLSVRPSEEEGPAFAIRDACVTNAAPLLSITSRVPAGCGGGILRRVGPSRERLRKTERGGVNGRCSGFLRPVPVPESSTIRLGLQQARFFSGAFNRLRQCDIQLAARLRPAREELRGPGALAWRPGSDHAGGKGYEEEKTFGGWPLQALAHMSACARAAGERVLPDL